MARVLTRVVEQMSKRCTRGTRLLSADSLQGWTAGDRDEVRHFHSLTEHASDTCTCLLLPPTAMRVTVDDGSGAERSGACHLPPSPRLGVYTDVPAGRLDLNVFQLPPSTSTSSPRRTQ